ncbi:MAG: hypothetical protein H6930_03310 [Rhodoferax sp.]|jgi:hypothetical protein|nr:hypothetical protein [Rhodoferax sp.]
MKISMHLALVALALAATTGLVHAKLPVPVLSEEAKAAAAAAADKAAWGNKVAAFKLCQSQDRAAAHYLAQARAAGKQVAAPVETPPCSDPGPYVAANAKPIEAAGAHSPAATATAPPSTKQADAVANPAKKP